MTYHILNGDALAEKFPSEILSGKIVIMGEAFIEGPTTTSVEDADFWSERSRYIKDTYKENQKSYSYNFVTKQLAILQQLCASDRVYLWFEDDLFCQTNMWFVIYYITRFAQPQFYRVFPILDKEMWSGFGKANSKELIDLYHQNELFTSEEIQLVNFLWDAYVQEAKDKLKALSLANSKCVRCLPEVIEAHLARIPHDKDVGRPEKLLHEIIDDGKTSFHEIFNAFAFRAGIYGFGDLQIKNMLKEMGIEFSGDLQTPQ